MIYGAKFVKPLHDFVLVKRCPVHESSPSGIVLTAVSTSNYLAEVVAVGDGRVGVPGATPTVKPGDKILIDKFIGMKVDIDGVEHTLVKWYDCQALVEIGE